VHRSYTRVYVTATHGGDTTKDSSLCLVRLSLRPLVADSPGNVRLCAYVYVLRVLVCLVTARGVLYRSKPSIEVTNVNAAATDCKAATPGCSGPEQSARWTCPGLSVPMPCLPRRYLSLRAKWRPTPLLG
jgi:hypothetical protein